jgi:hypothetical protein
MGFSGVLLAMSAVQAVSQISQGYANKAEANYNATLLEGKANVIGAQAEIEYGQYERLKGQNLSKSVASTAASGIGMGGSAMAAMLNAQTQIGIDQAIGQFNYQQEKNYTLNQASQVRRQGKQAVSAGYTNAFSTMLQGGYNYASYKGMLTPRTTVGTTKDTTFDSVQPYKYQSIVGSQRRGY